MWPEVEENECCLHLQWVYLLRQALEHNHSNELRAKVHLTLPMQEMVAPSQRWSFNGKKHTHFQSVLKL